MIILSRFCSVVVFIAVFLVNCSSMVLLLVMHAFIFMCFSHIFTVLLLMMCFVYSSDSD